MINIKDIQDNLRYSTEINEGCVHKKKLMAEDYIQLSFKVPQSIAFQRGDYILWEGVKYELTDFTYPTYNTTTGAYEYQLRLDAYYWKWKNKKLFYNRQGNREDAWHLTGTPDAHLAVVCSNLKSLGYQYNNQDFVYTVPSDLPAKNISYSSTNIIDALTQIAQAWEQEWWVEDNVIHLGKCEYKTAVELELEKNVTSMSRSESNDNFATRIYAFGSTRNLPTNYRENSDVVVNGVVQKRLMLPKDTPCIDAYPDMAQEEAVEAIVLFDDIYPRMINSLDLVTEARENELDENEKPTGKTYPVFTIRDKDLTDFKKEYLLDDLKLVFTSGALNGMDFSLNLKESDATGTSFVIVRNEDYGVWLPNDSLKPKEGDAYILYGFDTQYVSETLLPAAEKELKERAEAYMKKCKEDPSVYDCRMNMVDYTDLNVGDRVKLLNPAYFNEGGRQSRIYGFEKQLDGSSVTYTVGNTSKYSRLAQVENEIKEIVYQGNAYFGSAGGGVYVIGLLDPTTPTDRNVFSSKRLLQEMQNRSLSRLKKDMAAGHITFEDGILVKSSLSTPVARSVISTSLEEAGETSILSTSLVEESETPDILSTALEEKTLAGGYEDMSMDDLTNVEGFNLLDNGMYAFEMKDGVLYPIPAGDLAQANVMKLSFVSSGVMTVSYGNDAIIVFNFTSKTDGVSTGNGNATIYIGGRMVYAASIPQGNREYNVGSYLTKGENIVTVEVTDALGEIRKLTYSINAVSLSITSTYDASIPITEAQFTYRYTPMGAIEKCIHFIIDGEEVATFNTPVSNRQLTQKLPRGVHGSHKLEVFITATVGQSIIRSNSLFYDLIAIEAGKTTPVIASSFQLNSIEQYNTVVIPYTVYNPVLVETDVSLIVNDKIVSNLRINRTAQTWNYRMDNAGTNKLEIVCGSVRKTFQINVLASPIDVKAETTALELFLSSMGRSNSETNRDKWIFKNIAAKLNGFNWSTNGWLPDANGNIALKISGDAQVNIPVQPFSKDIRQAGKTIEIEFSTHDVIDYKAIIASCLHGGKGFQISAQSAFLSGDITKIESKFKEEERVRISFVIEENAENSLIYIYINGIDAGVMQYVETESFLQAIPQNIVLSSKDCTLNVYNIRIYDNNLNQYQILDNYIADMDDMEMKINLYIRNQVYNEYGLLTYEKVCDKIPCMTIIGDLPNYKGDKKNVSVIYENRQEPEFSFTAEGCQIDVQGTSSQYYPRKNYKTNFKKGFKMTASEEKVMKYKLTANMIGASVFCEKADFAESSGTHNTGIANLVDEVLKEMNMLTPPQVMNEKVRTTVCGFPIVIFHKSKEDEEPAFVGKYNFNTDKAAEETFGFTSAYPNCQCWEFQNNTSKRMLFKESEYKRFDTGNKKPDWLNDFEARYPDDDDLNEEYINGKIPENLKRVTDWVVSCIGNPDKFKAECDFYFNKDNLVFYFLFTELLGMIDQRAKNQFITTWDGKVWYFIFYDNDTCLGINNEGENVFNYNIETHDRLGTKDVWNGADSELWILVEQAYAAEIAAMYTHVRQQNILSYERVYQYLNINQSEKWCEAVYNEDGKFKYIDPLTEGYYNYGKDEFVKTGEFLYALQGSRAEHRKWWLFNRFRYLDSKYNAGQYFGDTVTLRLYTPDNWIGVAPDANFTLTPYADQYLRVKFGSYVSASVRGKKDIASVVSAPGGIKFNNTETIIYGASRLKSVGDLSGKYPKGVNMSNASKLEELIIGSNVEGYQNTNLVEVKLESNKLLRKINIENCPAYTTGLDLSGCESIQEVFAKGSGITSVVLPTGGIVELLDLPGTITNLTLRNQTKLTEAGLKLVSIANISTLWIENTPGIDAVKWLENCRKTGKLERVRLIGITRSGNVKTLFEWTELAGLDDNGKNTDVAVIAGSYHVDTITEYELKQINQIFPGLKITYETFIPAPVTTFIFRSEKGHQLENTAFLSNGQIVERINDYTFKVTASTDGDVLTYTFKADNHKPISGEHVFEGEKRQVHFVSYIPLRTIKVKISGKEVYPAATVTLDRETYQLGKGGTLKIRNGDAISLIVNVIGCGAQLVNLSEITEDATHVITVYEAVPLKITAMMKWVSAYSYLPNILVEAVNRTTGEIYEGLTNDNGDVTFYVAQGYYYDFTASYKQETLTDSIFVSSNGASSSVAFAADINEYKPEENGNIQLLAGIISGSLTQSITIVSSGSHTIDWGDGHTENMAGSGSRSLSHTYLANGIYTIEINNTQTITSFTYTHTLIAYWSIGKSQIRGLNFTNNPNLMAVGNVFKNDTNRTSFYDCFYNCISLYSVPEGLFDTCVETTEFTNCFRSCQSLVSIPAEMFYNCKKVTNFNYCFSDCSSLVSIPQGLFDYCPDVKEFYNCFSNCSSLVSLPVGLFDFCPDVTNYGYCFSNCEALISLPVGLFDYCPNVMDFSNCFYNCKTLASIPVGLFDNCPNVLHLNACFLDCSALKIIPAGLFDQCLHVSGFNNSFSGCSQLLYLVLPISIHSLGKSAYNGCTSLTYIESKTIIPPSIQSDTFGNTNNCPIYVPDEAVDVYKTATNWTNLADRIFPISEKTN